MDSITGWRSHPEMYCRDNKRRVTSECLLSTPPPLRPLPPTAAAARRDVHGVT